jgi:hypothetical protein
LARSSVMVMPSAAMSNCPCETAWIMPSQPISLKTGLQFRRLQISARAS